MIADTNSLFHNIAVLAHPQVVEAEPMAARIAEFLQARQMPASHGLLYDPDLRARVEGGEFDLVIALGGDGTMLRAGHLVAPLGLPLLGINLGRFGFLTEVKNDQWREFIPKVLQGDFWLEKRMMLRAEHWRNEQHLGAWDVLNEIVVSRGRLVRPVHLIASVDGRFLTTFVADALIAATATGSTAYALAAGGPILPPELRNILLVAVAPHLSVDRAIVLAEGSSVSIVVLTDHQAVLSPDGQPPIELTDGDRVEVHAGEHMVHFVRFQDPGYFYRNLTPHMSQNPATGITR
jgi:NAD+ kinase